MPEPQQKLLKNLFSTDKRYGKPLPPYFVIFVFILLQQDGKNQFIMKALVFSSQTMFIESVGIIERSPVSGGSFMDKSDVRVRLTGVLWEPE